MIRTRACGLKMLPPIKHPKHGGAVQKIIAGRPKSATGTMALTAHTARTDWF